MNKPNSSSYGKVITLIGAGASISVGVPAMKGIFKDFLNRRKSGISKEQKELCELFINELNVEEDLEEFLLAANLIVESPNSCLLPLFERSISKRRISNKVENFRLNFLRKIDEVKELRSNILNYMSRTCFQFNREFAVKYYANFVDAAATMGCPVFTTNYDFVYEYIAEDKNLKVIDNFKQTGQRNVWNNKVDFQLGDGLTIIKLHGSVSWYSDNEGNIEKIQSNTDINSMGKLIERMVVFPTRFKDIYSQYFFALYSYFLSSLSWADVLIVVGHSLRDEYLRAGIIERFRKGNFQIIVISPDFPESLAKELTPAKVGSTGPLMHIPYKFEDFSDELANMLLNFDPKDIGKLANKIMNHDKYAKNKIQIKGRIRKLSPGQSLDLVVKIKAFIKRDFKPSFIKVWLESQVKLQDGTLRDSFSPEFIQMNTIKLGDDVSGFIDDEFKVKVLIPKIKTWLGEVETVDLNIAIISKEIKKPPNISDSLIIARDTKKLKYGT